MASTKAAKPAAESGPAKIQPAKACCGAKAAPKVAQKPQEPKKATATKSAPQGK